LKELFGRDFPLSQYTTIGLGGPAKYFYTTRTVDELVEAVRYASSEHIKFFILGGGSNVVFDDQGFDGLVIKNEIKGIDINEHDGFSELTVNSGEDWDALVEKSVGLGLSGIECLSGIPGTVGATPVQNVGAYGQEVKDTIVSISALDLETLESVEFKNKDCNFEYRKSRFKNKDKGRYFIERVVFDLSGIIEPKIKYAGLANEIEKSFPEFGNMGRHEKLLTIRNTVIRIRRSKSMVIDTNDPDSRSCGSFFTNPTVTVSEFENLKATHEDLANAPSFMDNENVKIPAAWLIENSGFSKGYSRNGASISSKHTLALVNRKTSSKELLKLADEICDAIYKKFGIMLEIEPIIIQA
jgi:UDP-N-acetylmuramate dehydrogenase